MRRAIIGGLFAGFAAGIVQAILDISGFWELFSVHSYVYVLGLSTVNIILLRIVLYSLWGIVWVLLYSFFYNYIPDKGVKKGFIFGLLVWIAITVHPAVVMIQYGYEEIFIPWVLTGFFSICIAYGLLIGILYKKGD